MTKNVTTNASKSNERSDEIDTEALKDTISRILNSAITPSPTQDFLNELAGEESKTNLSEFIASVVEVYLSNMLKNPQIDQPINLDVEIKTRKEIQNPEVDLVSSNRKTTLIIINSVK